MKLYYWSWLLGLVSYVIGGVLRRSEWSPAETAIGMGGLEVFLLLILPAGIGAVLGGLSLQRREVQAWWAIAAIVLNIAMLIAGVLHLFEG